ncbi:MAG: hypothetical protein ACFFDU_08705 [Candidatus Thorarchaeota archaeon]
MNLSDADFDQFLDFLTQLSTDLSSGTSPEYALIRTTRYFGKQTPNEIAEMVKQIINGTKSFGIAWADLVANSSDIRSARLLELQGRFIKKGSVEGGERMLQVLQHVRKNSSLTKTRKNLISSQRVKVLALSFVSSVVIGMIAAIAPLLSFTFYQDLWISADYSSPSMPFFILIASSLTVIITGIRLNQTIGGSLRTLSFNLLAFGSTFILISHLLLSLL